MASLGVGLKSPHIVEGHGLGPLLEKQTSVNQEDTVRLPSDRFPGRAVRRTAWWLARVASATDCIGLFAARRTADRGHLRVRSHPLDAV